MVTTIQEAWKQKWIKETMMECAKDVCLACLMQTPTLMGGEYWHRRPDGGPPVYCQATAILLRLDTLNE